MNNLYSFTSGWLIHSKKGVQKTEAASSAEKDQIILFSFQHFYFIFVTVRANVFFVFNPYCFNKFKWIHLANIVFL